MDRKRRVARFPERFTGAGEKCKITNNKTLWILKAVKIRAWGYHEVLSHTKIIKNSIFFLFYKFSQFVQKIFELILLKLGDLPPLKQFFILCKAVKKPHSFQRDYPPPTLIHIFFLPPFFLSCSLCAFSHKTMFTRIMTQRIWKISRKRFFRVSIMTRMVKSTERSSPWSSWHWLKCPLMNNKFDIVESK